MALSDNFNRAGPGLGANWTVVFTDLGTIAIVSNAVVKSTGVAGGAYWTSSGLGDDHYSETTRSADNYLGPGVRMSGSGAAAQGYVAICNAIVPKVDLFKVIAGSFIFISTFSGVSDTGVVARLAVSGTTLSLYIDGAFVSSIVDASIPSGGDPGFYVQDGGGVDAWGADTVASPNPSISSSTPNSFADGRSVDLVGTNFGAAQGAGAVIISPTDNINDANAVSQTVTAWAATAITFTAVRRSMANGTAYLFVRENGGTSNAAGFAITLELNKFRLT